MFITALVVLFIIKLRFPKGKSIHHIIISITFLSFCVPDLRVVLPNILYYIHILDLYIILFILYYYLYIIFLYYIISLYSI